MIVESKSLPAEVNDLNIELYLLVEVKDLEKLATHIVLWILISLLQYDHIIILAMMRFVMTFDDTLRDSTSFSRKFTVLKIFTFTGIV